MKAKVDMQYTWRKIKGLIIPEQRYLCYPAVKRQQHRALFRLYMPNSWQTEQVGKVTMDDLIKGKIFIKYNSAINHA